MKYFVTALLLAVSVSQPLEAEVDLMPVRNSKEAVFVSHFPSVYDSIRLRENNYSNIKEDKGKETYGGITRRYNPDWYGWKYIDLEKELNGGELNRYHKVDKAELWVKDFYLDIWVKQGFDKIHDLSLADYLFDTRIHHYSSPKIINGAMKDIGHHPVKITNGEWIGDWVNEIDPQQLISSIRQRRMNLYYHLVKRDSSQSRFLNGWIKRLG